jgi:hypothetical protein
MRAFLIQARASRRQIGILRISAQIIDDKAATGNDLASVGADQFERALDQFGSDPARGVSVWVMMTVEGVTR